MLFHLQRPGIVKLIDEAEERCRGWACGVGVVLRGGGAALLFGKMRQCWRWMAVVVGQCDALNAAELST